MKGFCPHCEIDTDLTVSEGNEEVQVRNKPIVIESRIFKCSACGEDFYDPDTDPNEEAFKKYRQLKGWTTPEQIVEFRERYDLTQNELANLLGWGVATLSRYENGALQSESHERMLSLLRQEPMNLLSLLKREEVKFDEEKRNILIAKLTAESDSIFEDLFSEMLGEYPPSVYSGNQSFSRDKLYAATLFFCKGSGVFKTKLNKLLFYADFSHYKKTGSSITGAQYACIDHGPVVDNFNYYFASLLEKRFLNAQEQSFPGGYVGEVYVSEEAPDLSLFSQDEIKTLSSIEKTFSDFSATDIRNFSHKELGYKATAKGDLISYEFAKDLQI